MPIPDDDPEIDLELEKSFGPARHVEIATKRFNDVDSTETNSTEDNLGIILNSFQFSSKIEYFRPHTHVRLENRLDFFEFRF